MSDAGGMFCRMTTFPPPDLSTAAGIGVAGNVAGHLEQAGEASDFTRVNADPGAPKGIFPWYMPGSSSFLGCMPLADGVLVLPDDGLDHNLQIEPEVGVVFAIEYGEETSGAIVSLQPRAIGAFNDCSIRRQGAHKISQKKNWGSASKGLGSPLFSVDDLDAEGGLAGWRIASFLRRDGKTHAYGIDTAAADYSYAGDRLIEWLVDRLREQRGSTETPLEDVGALLVASGSPTTLIVGIGATRYTVVGESTYLKVGDESIVIVYDARETSPAQVAEAVANGREHGLSRASVLVQKVSLPDTA